MISLYTGTPGSGKSYHAAIDIYNWLRAGNYSAPVSSQAFRGVYICTQVLFYEELYIFKNLFRW